MNEGKPTKAKWWSRPRLQDLAEGPGGTDGAVAEDPGVHGPVTAAAEPTGTDGDFELARPAARPAEDGDYELRRPEAVPSGGPAGGLEKPAAPARGVGEPTPGRTAAEAVAAVPAAREPGGQDAAASVTPAAPVTSDAPVTSAAPVSSAGPAEGAPRPLHDPDPYSTPPYGEPGPWAPAPPVQHPMTTPAQGVAIPGQRPTVPGVPAAPSGHGITPPAQPSGVPAPAPAEMPTPAGDHGPRAHASAETPTPSGVSVPAGHAPTAHVPAPPAMTGMPVPPAAAGMPAPGSPVPMPAVPVHAGVPAPAPVPAPGPWQRYDPWAAPAGAGGHGPLQQNGAAVLSTEQRRKRGKKSLVLGAVLLALVSGGIGGVTGTYLERNGGVGTVELPQAGKEAAARDADSVAGIAGRALPSVVTLHVSGAGEQGTGTGFVLDTRGHILTNNHVVQPAGSGGEITVTFNGGQTAQAEVVGRDSGYDLAVVKVKGVGGLTPLPLGNSDNVQVGDPVVAIGAPFDLAGTVTSGIISAKQRPITAGGEKGDGSDVSYVDALQTDAPINPGNSGGPLLDARARVIGINSAIRSAGSGSAQDSGRSGSIGLGFAIPINQGKRVAEELINTGKATHPVIGITLDMDYTGDGARVATEGSEGGAPVTAGGPGAKAGIKSGDVITEVDGGRVHSGEELIVKTRAHRPGDRLELTVERGGKERKVSLVLGSSGG
ncbi:trypsin-like peptidase domain-containing protein [Streptomyces violaceochromogenes]|uniref:Trypsin-like peptidase domain-containing protein n=1 Tax=Streptomyces violaceochromogenes TaxID=67377 RepID=A0ABU6M420_9ACTN|nr:trypsin-like peptidase domain-containing protein [Streptomyces violaceochromogenes]MEC7056524.1 trypsin-like peptidase domain-containing protein [Streptomyces violaceochromogenes]GHC66698.1 protease [Streptomyces violaceochromogenes]